MLNFKFAHNAEIRVFCTDDEEEVRKKLLEFLSSDLEKEKVVIERSRAETKEGDLVILDVVVRKDRHIRKMVEMIVNGLSTADKMKLLSQKESRIDEHLNFFLRLDKKKLLAGEYKLTDKGDCFHFRINLASFPKKRKEIGYEIVEKLFG